MSVPWFDWDIQEEYLPAPAAATSFGTTALGMNGAAEIKAHTTDGISGGLMQLDNSTVTGPKLLITYRPLNSRGGIATTGLPACVEVFMTRPVKGAKPAAVLRGRWWKVGAFAPPKTVPLTIDNPGLFGSGIEDSVRRHFFAHVLSPRGKKMHPNTGGHRPGHDVLWDELAEMYGELGRQLGDPFYAELAAALAGPRR
jgi:hypothetical protein